MQKGVNVKYNLEKEKLNMEFGTILVTTTPDCRLPLGRVATTCIIKANTALRYDSIPVFVLGGFMVGIDLSKDSKRNFSFTGEIKESSIEISEFKEIVSEIKKFDKKDFSNVPNSKMSFILVYDSADMFTGIIPRNMAVTMKKVDKVKIKNHQFTFSGITTEDTRDFQAIVVNDDKFKEDDFKFISEKGDD